MKTIKAYALGLLSVLIGSGAVLVLLPVTLFWVFGVIFFISMGFFGAAVGVMEKTMPWIFGAWGQEAFTTVVLPGYGLVSLWWMVFSHRSSTLHEVPKKIWLGLAIGCVYAALFAGFRLAVSPPFITHENVWGDLTKELYFGVAPLLILFCSWLSMWLRGRWDASSQCSSSEVQLSNP